MVYSQKAKKANWWILPSPWENIEGGRNRIKAKHPMLGNSVFYGKLRNHDLRKDLKFKI